MGKLKDSLTRKIGPLPAWAYLIVMAGLLLVYRFWKNRKAAAATPVDTTADPSGQVPLVPDPGLSDGSIPQGGGIGSNGTSGASLDPNLQSEIDQLWELLNHPLTFGDPPGPGGPELPAPSPKNPAHPPPSSGSDPGYGASHPAPNDKPGFWWNMSGTETWVTADMKAKWLAYLTRTGTNPGQWSYNHPAAGAIMGIAPTPPPSQLPSKKVTTGGNKSGTGSTRPMPKTDGKAVYQEAMKTVAAHQGSSPHPLSEGFKIGLTK